MHPLHTKAPTFLWVTETMPQHNTTTNSFVCVYICITYTFVFLSTNISTNTHLSTCFSCPQTADLPGKPNLKAAYLFITGVIPPLVSPAPCFHNPFGFRNSFVKPCLYLYYKTFVALFFLSVPNSLLVSTK